MKKLIKRITKDSYFMKGCIGITLCLLVIFAALDTGVVSEFITWVFGFLFGWFLYAFYLIVFLLGLKLIFAKHEVKVHFDITLFGIILICVGILILATNSKTTNGEDYLVFGNFYSELQKVTTEFPKINFEQMSGGFFGYLIVGVLNSGISPIGTIVVGSLFLCLGIILALAKTIIKLFKNLSEYKNRTLKKNNLDTKEFSKAHDAKAFDTENILKETKLTTVVTQDFNIPREHTQTIAIQNPNGGVGVGVTSVNQYDSNVSLAKFEFNEEDTKENNNEEENKSFIKDNFDFEGTTKHEINEKAVFEKEDEIKNEVPNSDDIIEDKINDVIEDIENIQEEPLVENNEIIAKPINENKVSEETLRLAQTEQIKPHFERKNEINNSNINEVESDIESADIDFDDYTFPSPEIFQERKGGDPLKNTEVCGARMEVINEAFKDFNVGARAVDYTIGPSVTRFDIQVDANESAKTIDKYVDDIARRLKGQTCRFIQVVPNKDTSGLEIANVERNPVAFKDCIRYLNAKRLPGTEICFGKDIAGQFISADLTEFPHLLVGGCTNSGKSVFIHSLIATLMMRCKFNELKIAIIDPKIVEFSKYKDNPFLLCPPVKEIDESLLLLNELKDCMNERYLQFEDAGVENIKQYNKILISQGKKVMPRIVLIVDEFADLVENNKKISEPIRILAGKARAAGIHIVLATQRPSVNVIDGVIKGNINTRVALLCSSSVDSQTILGFGGAEKLTGYGDMLVNCPLISREGAVRIQGAYLVNEEIKALSSFLIEKYGTHYVDRFCSLQQKQIALNEQTKIENAVSFQDKMNASYDQIYEEAKKELIEGSYEYCSISLLTRLYSIGYNKAGRILKLLIQNGIVSNEVEANRGNKILVKNNSSRESLGSIDQTDFKKDNF